jgi:hypothetical protein
MSGFYGKDNETLLCLICFDISDEHTENVCTFIELFRLLTTKKTTTTTAAAAAAAAT